ncbi:hypothetical protein LPN04_17385 [Rugamonas sp. A1-17]|nr:hypothetical protein [Rugamonas sp. A1-17]
MKIARVVLFLSTVFSLLSLAHAENTDLQTVFVCRSPLLAFDFWSKVQALRTQGIEVNRKIVRELCKGMHVGDSPQCLEVQFSGIKPVASGWGGALALADSGQRIWFHEPDSGGWVHPDYYIMIVNRESSKK